MFLIYFNNLKKGFLTNPALEEYNYFRIFALELKATL